VAGAASASSWTAIFSVAPMIHLRPSESVEIVLGPRAGVWYNVYSVDRPPAQFVDGQGSGVTAGGLLGINAGLFIAVADGVSLGVIASVEGEWSIEGCDGFFYNGPHVCSSSGGSQVMKPLSLAVGALF
jgi:hypothetical protein